MGIRAALARGAEAVGNRAAISMLGALIGAPSGAFYRAATDPDEVDNDEFGSSLLGGAIMGASLPHVSQRFAKEWIENLASRDARYQAKVMSEVMAAARARGDDAIPYADGYGMRDYAEREGGGGFGEWLNERSDLVDDLLPDQREFDAMALRVGMHPPRLRDLLEEARAGSYLERSGKRLGDWRAGGPTEFAPLLSIPVVVAGSGAFGALDKRKRKTSASS